MNKTVMNKTERQFIENVLISHVGQINDSVTRASIVEDLSNELSKYSIICDESNNSPDVVESGKLVVEVDSTIITVSYRGVDFNEKA